VSECKYPEAPCACDECTDPRPKPAAPTWAVGDRAVWEGTYGQRDVTVVAVGPDWVGVTWLGGRALTQPDNLTRPAPKRRTVTVREWWVERTADIGVGELVWSEHQPLGNGILLSKPTGRTHTFETEDGGRDMSAVKVEKDEDGDILVRRPGSPMTCYSPEEARELYARLGEVLTQAPNCIHGRTPDEPCQKCDAP
jgi:hypothetical protein